MSVLRGAIPSKLLFAINSSLRKEAILLLGKIKSTADLKRICDSMAKLDNFHIGVKKIEDCYKLDMQYNLPKQGSAVATTFLYAYAKSVADIRTAFNNSLGDGYIWIAK